jgi:hypothetical protein
LSGLCVAPLFWIASFRGQNRIGLFGRQIAPLYPPLVYARLFPELARDFQRVDSSRFPPGLLISGAMYLAMMRATERDREFVA